MPPSIIKARLAPLPRFPLHTVIAYLPLGCEHLAYILELQYTNGDRW